MANSVTLFGRLVRDPEVTWKSDKCRVVFTVAVDRYKGDADFIQCRCFNKTAEIVAKYLKKGHQALVMGNLKTGNYEKDGRTVYFTEVWADKIEFAYTPKANKDLPKEDEVMDNFAQAEDEIPF